MTKEKEIEEEFKIELCKINFDSEDFIQQIIDLFNSKLEKGQLAERERCLKICEEIKQLDEDVGYYIWLQELTQKIKEGEGK